MKLESIIPFIPVDIIFVVKNKMIIYHKKYKTYMNNKSFLYFY